jgi:hypothetical protein
VYQRLRRYRAIKYVTQASMMLITKVIARRASRE